MFARKKIAATACALAVGLGGITQASGALNERPAKEREARSELRLERPTKRIHDSIRAWRRQREHRVATTAPEELGISTATLEAIAACESGGNPAAVSADGTYRGKYQFDYGTWASVGGSGDPAAALEAEQDMRAAMLYARSGSSPWPVCGV